MTDQPKPAARPLVYNMRGAAEAVSVSDKTLRAAIRAGTLKARALGPRKFLIEEAALMAWFASLPETGGAA